jgi:uncharacterized membrane protein YqjE
MVRLFFVLAGLILLATAHALYGLTTIMSLDVDSLIRLSLIVHAGAAFYCAGVIHLIVRGRK